MLSVKYCHENIFHSTENLNTDLHCELAELRRKANECLDSSSQAEVLQLITNVEQALL